MKTVFVATKSAYGAEFFEECDSLQELKKAIVAHTYMFKEEPPYTEEVFNECLKLGQFQMYEVNLHPSEMIVFNEYDGSSDFSIEKIERNILSTTKRVR